MNACNVFLWGCVTIVFCLLIACGHKSQIQAPQEGLCVIDVESALADLQDGLKLSDFGSRVRYVPLETNDSCLVAAHPKALVTDGGGSSQGTGYG